MSNQDHNTSVHGLYSFSTPKASEMRGGIALAVLIAVLMWIAPAYDQQISDVDSTSLAQASEDF